MHKNIFHCIRSPFGDLLDMQARSQNFGLGGFRHIKFVSRKFRVPQDSCNFSTSGRQGSVTPGPPPRLGYVLGDVCMDVFNQVSLLWVSFLSCRLNPIHRTLKHIYHLKRNPNIYCRTSTLLQRWFLDKNFKCKSCRAHEKIHRFFVKMQS